jgi:hypothetical protein
VRCNCEDLPQLFAGSDEVTGEAAKRVRRDRDSALNAWCVAGDRSDTAVASDGVDGGLSRSGDCHQQPTSEVAGLIEGDGVQRSGARDVNEAPDPVRGDRDDAWPRRQPQRVHRLLAEAAPRRLSNVRLASRAGTAGARVLRGEAPYLAFGA